MAKKYVSKEGKKVSTEQKEHLRQEREYRKGDTSNLDLFGRPKGDPHYGEDDFDRQGRPNFTAGVLLAPEALEAHRGPNPNAVGMRGKMDWAQTDAWYDEAADLTFWVNEEAYKADASRKKPPKLDWNHLVEHGFTNEIGSPQEAAALEDLIKRAPIGTVYNFINNMDDDLRYGYLPPLTKLLAKRLKDTDLRIEEDFSLSFDRALGKSVKDTLQRTNG